MTENSGLSLRDKLLFEANHKTYVIRFLATLEIQQGISEEEALACLRVLVDFGLPLYDPAKMWTDEFRLSKQLADRAIAAKLTNLLQPHEMSMAQIPDLSFLLIDRDELFEIFNRKGFNKPYPWPHTLPEWLNPNPDEKEEIPAASLADGKEAPEIPNGEAQSANLFTADQQRLPYVLAMIKELGFDQMNIPRSGKRRILEKLLASYPRIFTADKFESTWKAGKRDGLLKTNL